MTHPMSFHKGSVSPVPTSVPPPDPVGPAPGAADPGN